MIVVVIQTDGLTWFTSGGFDFPANMTWGVMAVLLGARRDNI